MVLRLDLPPGMLSKTGGEEGQLHAVDLCGRTLERCVDSFPEVTIGKQIEAQHSHEIRHRPGKDGSQFENLQEQYGDECGPELHMKCIHAGPPEGLDSQILFDRLEEDLDLPPVFIDGRDGGAAKGQVIGQENDGVLVLFIPHFNAS